MRYHPCEAADRLTFSRTFPGADDPRFTELDALIAAGVTKPAPYLDGRQWLEFPGGSDARS